MLTCLKNRKKKISFFLLFTMFVLLGGWSVLPVSAVSNDMFAGESEAFRETVGFSDRPLSEIIGSIINIVLGVLGIVLVILIIYAGITWMTAGSDPEKVKKAKTILTNAGIGLLITVSAWAIASFIISSLNQAVGDGEGGSGSGSGGGSSLGGGGSGGSGGGGLESFQVKSIVPSSAVKVRNVKVRVLFNRDLDAGTINEANIYVENNGTPVDGTVSLVNNRLAEFVPNTPCPEPYQSYKCFEADTDYTVTVKGSVANNKGDLLGDDVIANFTTGVVVDVAEPSATILLPTNYQGVAIDDGLNIQTEVSDDGGVSLVEFFANNNSFASPITIDPPKIKALLENVWLVAGSPLSLIPLQVKVSDIAGNDGQSSIVYVKIRPAYCFNGKLDADKGETDIDCGGDCGICSGGTCRSAEDCSSGSCSNGICQLPIKITSISPDEGKSGNFMTIRGVNFGQYEAGKSKVFFVNKVNGTETEATVACVGSWRPDSVVVEVPEFSDLVNDGTDAFVIKVQSKELCDGQACVDTTDNDNGWKGYYVYNSALSFPGLCNINPQSVLTKTTVELNGKNLSSVSKIYFGKYVADQGGAISNTRIDGILVPNLVPGTVQVTVVDTKNQVSNPVYVKILKSQEIPEILNISPTSGAPGQYLYIEGKNFGSTVGNVWFSNNNVGKVLADVSFPADCAKNWWNNNFILVKVPNVSMGEYNISIENTQGVSLDFPFTVNNQPLSPGICKVDPGSGPPSTQVTIYGDGFGTRPMELFLDTQPFIEISSWRNQKIETVIPSIGDGRYAIRLLNSEGIYSNSYNFNVQHCSEDAQCDDGLLCCSDGSCRATCKMVDMGKAMYQWKFSTGKIPFVPKVIESKSCDNNLQSPSPWFNSTNSCVNAVVSARFNTEMEESSLLSGVKVQNCGVDANCNCDTANPCTDIRGNITIVDTSESNSDGTIRAMNGFVFSPNTHFTAGQWYKVTISKGILSKAGNPLPQNYSWKFKVRDNEALCTVEKVDVLPLNKIIATNQTVPYNTVIKGSNCLLLNPSDYSFVWSLKNNSDNFAEFVSETGDANFDNYKDVLGLKVTPSGHKVEVMCAVSDAGGNTYTNKTPALFVVTEDGSVLSVKQISDCNTNVPSPSPAKGYEKACLNTVVSAQFSAPVSVADLNNSKILLQRCNGNPAEEGVTCEQSVALSFSVSSYLRDSSNQIIGFVAQTGSDLAANTWYQVTIKGGSDGITGQVNIDGVVKNIYLLNDYKWTFKTGTAVCALEKVLINPRQAIISVPNGTQDYLSCPLAIGCNMIKLSNLKWQWSASPTEPVNLSLGTGPTRTVTALQETVDSPVKISVSYEGVLASSDLFIKFAAPKLSYYYPQCNEACLNSSVGVEFSQSVDLDRLSMTLYKCANESCLDYNLQVVSNDFVSISDGGLIDPSVNKAFIFNIPDNLTLNTYYKVVVKNVFSKISNKKLSNYNVDKNSDGENDAYEWIFKTNTSGTLCNLKSVKVSPVNTLVSFIGAKQEYFAMPLADKDVCNPRGNLLNPYNFIWDWQSSDNDRASITSLSLNLNLPSYCTSNCLLKGSKSNVVLCGNGKVEKGEDCDDGNTSNNDGCSRNCLWEGTSAPKCGNGVVDYGEACDIGLSTIGCTNNCLKTGVLTAICGNGKVENGEACDDGNGLNSDGCNEHCLYEGTSQSANVCSNGIIEHEKGEECDDGNVKSGDGCSSVCLLEGYSSFTVNGEAICGDGIVNRGTEGKIAVARGEACDDGNVFNGDGCNNKCLFDGNAVSCGNGILDTGEACDDGNTDNNDGCSNKCLFEGNKNVVASCGNGSLERGEACDDGNIYNNDGCSSSCLWEGKFFSKTSCGNGIKDYGEACDYRMAGWEDICSDQCQLLGSQMSTGSVCGNGSIGEGEACDDGNRFDGDGCSSKCLNEGSKVLEGVAVCGNNILETSLGEECDDGNVEEGDGCSSICLKEGNRLASCGNGVLDRNLGEDCDDGNRLNSDGCSSICLNEGSSYKYDSVCGNSLMEKGEECEAASVGDKVSPYQWAVVNKFKADSGSAKTSTVDIIARETKSGVSGSAKLVLQCSFESDDQCPSGGFDYGVGKDSCCYIKSMITDHLPVQNEVEVCRNPQIQALFDGQLDRGTALMNTTLLQRMAKTDDLSTCQQSEKYRDPSSDYVLCKVSNYDLKITSWKESVDGVEKNYSLLSFILRDVLSKNSEYYLIYEDKIKTTNGVSLKITENDLMVYSVDTLTDKVVNANVYHFKTGTEVCQVSQLQIMNIDSRDKEPFSLTVPGFSKRYQVLALDQRGKPVAPVAGVYDWIYNWAVNDTDIADNKEVKNSDGVIVPEQIDLYPGNNGLTELMVQAEIKNNLFAYSCTVNDECSSEQCASGKCKDFVSTTQKINVFVCANPWPNNRLYVNDFFNFSMRYCRDTVSRKICYGGIKSGQTCKKNADCVDNNSMIVPVCKADLSSSLPALRISTIIPPNIIKETTGLIREYLFHLVKEKTYCYDNNMMIIQHEGKNLECIGDYNINKCLNAVADGGYNGTCLVTPVVRDGDYTPTGDVIGLRVFKNEDNLTPLAWYEKNMYGGATVTSTKIDGYPAVANDRNTYVNAVNLVPDSRGIYNFYSNIYLFTYNEGADSKTKSIYKQLMDSLYFNMNLYRDADYYSWQSFKTSAYAYKQQLIRDLYRLYSFHDINVALENYYKNNGFYPKLTAGSLLPGISYSTWPSWRNELGMNVVDPINKFSNQACVYAYGKCVRGGVETGSLCSSDRDCISATCPGCICKPSLDNLYNQKTCYNSATMSFDENQAFFSQPESYVYRYQVLDDGANYKLDYHLEYLKHVQFSSEGESRSELMGVGQCYSAGVWYKEGEKHPSQPFTFCRLGRWINSCGNGRVEVDLGEQCETSVNMCNEMFGKQAWYTPQIKTCNNCLWQGLCSNILGKTCTDDSVCNQNYGMAACEKHPLINNVKVCSGAGVNNGKLCNVVDDCQISKGVCVNFEDSFKIGRCHITSTTTSNIWKGTTICQKDEDCSDFYKYYYCNINSPIACIKENLKTSLEIDQNNISEDCRKCADRDGVCVPEKHCVDVSGDTVDSDFFCVDNSQCVEKFGENYGTCMAISDGNIKGTCYTQNNENTGIECYKTGDCLYNLKSSCAPVGTAGFDIADCGGYCGDGKIQLEREVCDWKHPDYYSSNNPDQTKIYCSNNCSSSCPSGTSKNVFYQGDSYFLRRYCVGTGNSNVDGKACVGNEDCRATVGGVIRQGTCQLDTLYTLSFNVADGFPTGVNLYLPPCNRLAQGSWTCQSTNSAYLKQGAWCHPDYDEHCVDKNGVVGTCTEAFNGKEPPGFMVDITLDNLQAPTLNVVFVIDKSGSMNTTDVSCGDPKGNSGSQKICEVYKNQNRGTRLVYDCPNGQPAAECVAAGVTECKVRDSRFECALDALTNSSNGAIKKLVDFSNENNVPINMSAVFFSSGTFSPVPSSSDELIWYDSLSVSAFINFLNGQIPTGGTYTDDGFKVASDAISLKESNLMEDGKVSNSILILLTDGDVDNNHAQNARVLASRLKKSRVSLYTIAYPKAINNTFLWSSECPPDNDLLTPTYPPCQAEPSYAYSSASNLNDIYDEIINRITITLSANALSTKLYGGRYMPLPGIYRCQNQAQLLPLNINVNQSLRGNIKLQNLKFNYCP